MKFKQTYSYNEDGYGKQDVLFAVSDVYGDLFDNEKGYDVDVFMLDRVAQDLNVDEGSYAVDELTFDIYAGACDSDAARAALYFTLDAANLSNIRYVALFFGDEPTLANLLFAGKITDAISADDRKWHGLPFAQKVNPVRKYSFQSLSLDVSLLKMAIMDTDGYGFKAPDGSIVDDIVMRLEDNDWAAVKTIFDWRLSYATETKSVYLCPLANIYKVIKLYLDTSADIINEALGLNITFNLLESDFGIKTSPTAFTIADPFHCHIKPSSSRSAASTYKDIQTGMKFDDDDSGVGWATPFVHRKMIHPRCGDLTSDYSLSDISLNDLQRSRSAVEYKYSFASLENTAALLFEFARAFDCYLVFNLTAMESIDVSFMPRSAIVESDITYLLGVTDASLDTGSALVKGGQRYYALANNLADDGHDRVVGEINSLEALPSDRFLQKKELLDYEKKKKGNESERLLLSTSSPLFVVRLQGSGAVSSYCFPFNVIDGSGQPWESDVLIYYGGGLGPGGVYNAFAGLIERLTTGLYIKTVSMEPEQIDFLGDTPVWRPASGVLARVDGKDKQFNTLSQYINSVQARDKFYYETEYELSVPYWNGFSKNSDGSGAGWDKIKLGSKIRIKEDGLVYSKENQQFAEQEFTRDFVVVGIERSLQKPETKLKLHSLVRFSAFGEWDGDPETLLSDFLNPNVGNSADLEEKFYQLELAEGESVSAGDAVQAFFVDSTIKIRKAVNVKANYYQCIGVALSDGEGGDLVNVQVGGRVVSDDYSFSGSNLAVYVRKNASGLNISETLLAEKTSEEDTIIIIGVTDSANSFILKIQEYVLK